MTEAGEGIEGFSRRSLLGRMLAAVPLLWAGQGAFAKSNTTVDVRRFGARGDGRTDDTRAFQAAIDSLRNGGIVDVPSGVYRIDAERSVRLRSGVHLRLARSAQLHAIPNAIERSYVLLVQEVRDVRITGGRIVGERDRHRGASGEWGHGIAIYASQNVSVRDIHIAKCWGDGISIGGRAKRGAPPRPSMDVEIANVTCLDNRRQGLTIGRSRRVRVFDCEFSDTGGTPPATGIDVEPDAGDIARDVRIERCVVRRNKGPGIQVWKNSSSVTIRDCTIEDNRNSGILTVGAHDIDIERNRIRGNGKVGIVLRQKSGDVSIAGNTFARNAPGRARSAPRGRDPRWARHLETAADTGAVRIAPDNRFD